MVQQVSKPGAKGARLLKAGHPPAGKLLSSHSACIVFILIFNYFLNKKDQRVVALAARFRLCICARTR